MHSFIKHLHAFDLSDKKQTELAKAVQLGDLKTTQQILGLSPKRVLKSLSILNRDGISGDLDIVTHAFFHGSGDLYKLLVERLGILDFRHYTEHFQDLTSVDSGLEKLKTLEAQSVVLPFNSPNSSWLMNYSGPALFNYLLEKGYVREIMKSMNPTDVENLAKTMNPKRHARLVGQNSRPSQSA
jgi:hypothetical protein